MENASPGGEIIKFVQYFEINYDVATHTFSLVSDMMQKNVVVHKTNIFVSSLRLLFFITISDYIAALFSNGRAVSPPIACFVALSMHFVRHLAVNFVGLSICFNSRIPRAQALLPARFVSSIACLAQPLFADRFVSFHASELQFLEEKSHDAVRTRRRLQRRERSDPARRHHLRRGLQCR